MKIVHVCLNQPYIDGWGYQENMLPRHQAELGHDVIVVGSRTEVPIYCKGKVDFAGYTEPYMDGPVQVIRIRHAISILGRLTYYPALAGVLEQIKPDLIFHHNGQAFSLLTCKRFVDRNARTALFVDFHTEFYNSATNWLSRRILHGLLWKTLIRYALSSIDQIYCISRSTQEFCERMYGIDPARVELLFLGADAVEATPAATEAARLMVRKRLGMGEGDFLVVTGGKINPAKRFEVLVEAVKALDRDSLHVVIFGTPDPGLETYALGIPAGNARVHMVGWCDGAAINEYFLAADLAVFTGGQSVLWQQSIATGLPGLFRKWRGHEHLNQGNCMYLYSDSSEELLQWLGVLTDERNAHLLEQMRAKAMDLAKGEMSYRAQAEKILQRYQKHTERQQHL